MKCCVVSFEQQSTRNVTSFKFYIEQIVCTEWNKASEVSLSLATLLPFNFSVACPSHLPHNTVCALTTPAPLKHCMPWPAPQHDQNIQLSLLRCPSVHWHPHAWTNVGFQQCQKLCMFACVNAFDAHQWCPLLPGPKKEDTNHFYYYNFHFSVFATNVKACNGVATHKERSWGKEEAETGEPGPLSGDRLPTSALSTPGHTRQQTHRRGLFQQWRLVSK